MITVDGIQYRNLEEQVKKNMDDIQFILEEEGVLNAFGIKVVGQITNAGDLPDAETYEGEFGDAYAVGTSAPYTLYIYTRANGEHPTNYWFNIGQFPLAGPIGPTGPIGAPGEPGVRGSLWFIGKGMPTTNDANVNDKYLNTINGNVYSYTGSQWYRYGNIRGPQGIRGIQGPQGIQGAQGPQGAQGQKGDAGQSFEIVGIVSSESQLPTPSTLPDNQAYLVGTEAPYDMYVQVNEQWVNIGIVQGVQGPQGPQGPQGVQGPQGIQGEPGKSFNGRGEWVSSNAYQPYDLVSYDGSSYYCIQAISGGTDAPPIDTEHWQLLAEKGDACDPYTLVEGRGENDDVAISQLGIEEIFFSKQLELGKSATILSTNPNSSAIVIGYQSIDSAIPSNGIDNTVIVGSNISTSQPNAISIGANIESSQPNAISIGCGIQNNGVSAVAIGDGVDNGSPNSISIGTSKKVGRNCPYCISIGSKANISDNTANSILLGTNCNCSTSDTFQVGDYPLLDLTTGLIPDDRLPDTTIPIANSTTLGGVMPVNKTDDMTQEVGVDSTGKLYTAPGGGGDTVKVVQGLGTSTTAVISQNGINTLLRGNNALLGNIKLTSDKTTDTILIGTNAHDYNTGSSNCIAIGTNTECGALGGVAIGANTHVYSSSYNCIAIGKNVTITDNLKNVIALGHDFSIPLSRHGNDKLVVQNTPVMDFITGKILPEVLPPIAMSSIRIVCNKDSQYVTSSYSSPKSLTNGVTPISIISSSINNIGATRIDTMIPAYGQYNNKQVVGIFSSGSGINIIFQDGTNEEMSSSTRIITTSTTPTYASTQSTLMKASSKAVSTSPNSSTH